MNIILIAVPDINKPGNLITAFANKLPKTSKIPNQKVTSGDEKLYEINAQCVCLNSGHDTCNPTKEAIEKYLRNNCKLYVGYCDEQQNSIYSFVGKECDHVYKIPYTYIPILESNDMQCFQELINMLTRV